jgi:hypothetical protein
MADALEIGLQMPFHRNGHAIFEKLLLPGRQFGGQVAHTLLGVLAISGATEVHFGVDETMPAMAASARGVIFEKLHMAAALGAFDVKNGIRIPVLGVLTRAFHDPSPAT